MSTPVFSSRNAFTRAFLTVLRRLFLLPLLLGVLGAGLAGWFGVQVRPTAESLVSVNVSSTDAVNLDRVMEGWVRQVGSTAVLDRAARDLGVDVSDLRARTRVSTVTNSPLVSVLVTAADENEASRQSVAVANAAVDDYRARIASELDRLRDDTQELMDNPAAKMNNDSAEKARVNRLGDELGTGQAVLVSGANEVTVLEAGQPASTVVNPVLFAVMGFVGGVLLGCALLMLMAARTPRIQTSHDLQQRYPHLPVVEPTELRAVIYFEADVVSTLVVAQGLGSPAQADYIARTVRDQLEAHGRSTSLFDPRSGQRPQWAALPPAQAAEGRQGDPRTASNRARAELEPAAAGGARRPGSRVRAQLDHPGGNDVPKDGHADPDSDDGDRSSVNGHVDGEVHDRAFEEAALDAELSTDDPQKVNIMAVPLTAAVVRRTSRDPSALLLIPVEPMNQAGLALLERYAPSLSERTYLVVAGPERRRR